MRDDKMEYIKMEAAIFFDSHLPNALRRALEYAGNDGFVASMPQLLHARVNAPYDNIIWNTWFTANSEESVVKTPQGHHVVVAVHGGGIFASPERFERAYRATVDPRYSEGLTKQYAAKISEREARNLLAGKLPDGTEIPVYSFSEFKRGVADPPMRYAVVLDLEIARKSPNGYVSFDVLKDDPLTIIRAGGIEPLAAYLDKAKARRNTNTMGTWHPFNRIDPDEPQTRVLFLARTYDDVEDEEQIRSDPCGYDGEYGIGGDASMTNMGQYVAVAPRNVATSLRYLDFGG